MTILKKMYYYLMNTHLNHNSLLCGKAKKLDLTVCIVVNGEKCQSHAVTLTLIMQAMRNVGLLHAISILQYVQDSS